MAADDVIRIAWSFAATPDRVFGAWSDADRFRLWAWGQLGTNTGATVDCRVGGRYRVRTECPAGPDWEMFGEFLECVPGSRLVYTVNWTAPMGYESPGEVVAVDFRARDGGTEIDFVHTGVPIEVGRAEHRKGWIDTLKTLARLLEAGGTP